MQVEDNLALISRGRGNYVDLARLQCPSKPARCPDRYGGFSCAQDYYKWTNVQLAKNKELWQARAEEQQRVRGSRSHVPVLMQTQSEQVFSKKSTMAHWSPDAGGKRIRRLLRIRRIFEVARKSWL